MYSAIYDNMAILPYCNKIKIYYFRHFGMVLGMIE
jgi:hypothetical protein